MKVNNKHYRTIWVKKDDHTTIRVINQQKLPHKFEIMDLRNVEDFRVAIKDMHIRGAGVIGATAAFGMYIAALTAPENKFDEFIEESGKILKATRPTASNLAWAVERMTRAIAKSGTVEQKREIAFAEAQNIADEDAEFGRRIGEFGKTIIEKISKKKKGGTVNILTHCNAGWLAMVDYGSALSPVYAAFDAGIKFHIWVDETRPRNQGTRLTAWELGQYGVPYSIIADNTGGHLMQHGMVDMVIVGTDRVARNGDVANKIGTYLKALAAKDNHIPFYVTLPSSTFDFSISDGLKDIPIEERDSDEVRYISGKTDNGNIERVLLCPENATARNWGFDVTPARLITKLICERGICDASEEGIFSLFPEKKTTLDEGYIKYHTKQIDSKAPKHKNLNVLNEVRTELFDKRLIGVYPNGIGFGNLSIRKKGNQFIITGSATGAKRKLSLKKYCLVKDFDIKKNRVCSKGKIKASSEAMTHGAVYSENSNINCVIHIHSKEIFDFMVKNKYPSTPQNAAFGSPDLALAIAKLVKKQKAVKGIIVLKGHQDGVIAYGADIKTVKKMIFDIYRKAKQ